MAESDLRHFLFGDVHRAMQREKSINKRPRQWKDGVIEDTNSSWNDLYATIL